MPRLTDLKGLWRRSLLALPDGKRDTDTRVQWLQADSLYADLRQPPLERLQAEHLSSLVGLADYSLAHCARLADQQGFAGRLSFDGNHFEWARLIDFQPRSHIPDAGSLQWDGEVLVERGREVHYVEHWHRDVHHPTTPAAAMQLHDARCGADAVFVRVGADFMFARSRSQPLPALSSLRECIAAAPSAAAAQSMIDCEISTGSIVAGTFTITESTLPYRRSRPLRPLHRLSTVSTADVAPDGSEIERRWQVIALEGNGEALQQTVGFT